MSNGNRDNTLLIGLLAGAAVGAGLAFWLAPQAAGMRKRLGGGVRDLADRAREAYEGATARVGDTTDDLTKKGQQLRNDVANSVASGAHEVERMAKAARS